jgi:sigma-B regulation protein RsbU (phosphoserine phosphatase)
MKNNKIHIHQQISLLADQSLKDQLLLKDRVLASAAEGIVISDKKQPDNPIIYANKGFEKLTGYRTNEVLGKNCRFLQGPETNQDTIQKIKEAIRETKEITVEILNYRKDGTPFWNRLSITPVKNENGEVVNFIGIQSDITAIKHAQEKLERTAQQLETANRSMRRDLEDARRLQLAMLPDKVPMLPYLDIAIRMKTAQEIGGDYYDFFPNEDGSLTVILGDATGHGLKAGTIVTVAKSAINTLKDYTDPKKIFKKVSFAIKQMGFKNMYMAMQVAKFSPDKLVLSSAGIPYTFVYQQCNNRVKKIEIKGLPLGSFPDFRYRLENIKLQPGDKILMMSDGLLELYNRSGEIFGEKRVLKLFQKVAKKNSAEIIEGLVAAAANWSNLDYLSDDMTFLVIQMK